MYVDALAGPGLCKVRNPVAGPPYVNGSPLVALNGAPDIHKCVFLEYDPHSVQAPKDRTVRFGDKAVVYQGDVNADLTALIRQHVPPQAPCFCLLDPEGVELHWETVEGIASLAGRKRKPELLILFPIENAIRLLPTKKPMTEYTEHQLERWLGTSEWQETYRARLDGSISPNEALQRYVDLYESRLRGLGYAFVEGKEVTAPAAPGRQRRTMYRLVFASDHSKGAKIMGDVFTRPYVLDFPVTGQMPLEL